MNILDIAIAKKLAGGGGGSGTDNYNDLSNLPKINDTTLSGNKSSSALGLQDEIDSDNKLSSDLVDDTNATNKFVTEEQKNTWNGKQNTIDSDHKLNADLVDDSTSTNKFVTSSDMETWNAKQNAIDSDHKLSSSLVNFSNAEAAALASGIDSNDVQQIGVNQTNILYAINTGVKNELDNRGVTSYTHNGITYTFNKDGSVTLKGTASGNSVFYYFVDGYVYIPNNWKGHILSGVTSGSASTYSLTAQYSNNGTSWATEANCITEPITIASNYNYINFSILVRSGVTVDTTIYPMLCDPTVWAQSHDFMPPALPNSDLTYLEAEDRAALAEVVDSGAKNLLDTSTTTVSNITFTQDSNSYITASPNNADTRSWNYANTQYKLNLKAGTYVFAMDIKTATSNNGIGFHLYSSNGTSIIHSETSEILNKTGMVTWQFTITTEGTYGVIFKCFDMVARLMICTKAAFGVSPAFQPWRGIKVPTIHSNSSGRVTIDRGGYVKVGNICTITMRFTVSTAIDESKWIFYCIPHHVFDINDDHGVMCERIKAVSTTNNNEVTLNLSGYDSSMSGIGTGSGTTLPVGTYNLSWSYISDK